MKKLALILGIMMFFTLGCKLLNKVFSSTFTPSPPNFHLFVAISGLTNENDQLALWSGDNESHRFCSIGCPDKSKLVQVTKGVIIVQDGFPISYDQWTVFIEIASPNRYPKGTIEVHIIYKGESWSCLNDQNDLVMDYKDQNVYLIEIDPSNFDPAVHARAPFSCVRR